TDTDEWRVGEFKLDAAIQTRTVKTPRHVTPFDEPFRLPLAACQKILVAGLCQIGTKIIERCPGLQCEPSFWPDQLPHAAALQLRVRAGQPELFQLPAMLAHILKPHHGQGADIPTIELQIVARAEVR